MTNDRTLTLFGGRDDIREMADRIRSMLPGGQKYTESEALTLAQMSVAHGLDPFNGEVWLIKGDDGKVFGALIGIKGQRRHAKQQATYWGVGSNGGFTRITDPKVLEQYGATSPGDVVYEYRIMDEVTIREYGNALHQLVKIGFALEDAQKVVGPPPVTMGIGVFKVGEKSKMKASQCAMFRAEKDALKRRFDVTFSIPFNGQPVTAEANGGELDDPAHEEIEAEYAQFEEEPEPRSPDEILEELGYTSDQRKAPEPTKPDYSELPDAVKFVTNRDGVPYTDIPTDKLKFMAKSLAKSLADNHLDDDEKQAQTDKLAAARAILDFRTQHHLSA